VRGGLQRLREAPASKKAHDDLRTEAAAPLAQARARERHWGRAHCSTCRLHPRVFFPCSLRKETETNESMHNKSGFFCSSYVGSRNEKKNSHASCSLLLQLAR
jgi:hypothetical protein